MSHSNITPIGHRIASYEVLGEERNQNDVLHGVDLACYVPPLGHYSLSVVTKLHFADQNLEQALQRIRELEPEDFSEATEVHHPFVVNDVEITPDVLRNKFLGRVVAEDLAACMTHVDDSVLEN